MKGEIDDQSQCDLLFGGPVEHAPSRVRKIEKLGHINSINLIIGQFVERHKLSLTIVGQPRIPLLHKLSSSVSSSRSR